MKRPATALMPQNKRAAPDNKTNAAFLYGGLFFFLCDNDIVTEDFFYDIII
jgi:hypothetical protein